MYECEIWLATEERRQHGAPPATSLIMRGARIVAQIVECLGGFELIPVSPPAHARWRTLATPPVPPPVPRMRRWRY